MVARAIILKFLLILPIGFLVQDGCHSTVEATRRRFPGTSEPNNRYLHLANRAIMMADSNLYHFERGNVTLREEDLPIGRAVFTDPKLSEVPGMYEQPNFKPNASIWIKQALDLKWFVPISEMGALHVYDDPEDKQLAKGRQVNQQLCGLHLDYLIYLVDRHLKDFDHTTDLNSFVIMNSFGVPSLGLNQGNVIFAGDYSSCLASNLLITKNELAEMLNNSREAEHYFRDRIKEKVQAKRQEITFHEGLFEFLGNNLGPLLGFARPRYRLNIEKYQDEVHSLPMRYCMAGLRWPTWPNSTYHRRNHNLRLATCLPESCDSDSLIEHEDKIKRLINFQMTNYFSNYYIENLYCLPDNTSPSRSIFSSKSAIAFLAFNLCWLCLTILASFRSSSKAKNSTRRQTPINTSDQLRQGSFLSSWNVRVNLLKFLRPTRTNLITIGKKNFRKRDSNEVDLERLDLVKFFSSLFIITAHACMLGFGNINENAHEGHKMLSNSIWSPVNIICPASVDIFFVMTGVITMKTLMSLSRKALNSFPFWLQFFVYRYIRIIPLYLTVQLFLRTTFRFIGSGPFWDYGTSHTAWSHLCQTESLWEVLVPRANFKSPFQHCNHVGWYLANDLQFTLLTPFVVLAYITKPLFGHFIVYGSFVAVMINHIKYYLDNMIDHRSMLEWSFMTITNVSDDYVQGYVNPKYRCLAHLIGLSGGYILYRYERGDIKKWPIWFLHLSKGYLVLYIYFVCTLTSSSSLVNLENEEIAPQIKWIAAIVAGGLHGLTSIAVTLFILLYTTNQLEILSFTSNRLFNRLIKPLANAALSIMLVHLPLQYYHTQKLRHLEELSSYRFFVNNLIWTLESIALASIVHILYELPMRRLAVKSLFTIFSRHTIKPALETDDEKEKVH